MTTIYGAAGMYSGRIWGIGFSAEDALKDARKQVGFSDFHIVEISVEEAKQVANGELVYRRKWTPLLGRTA